MNQSRRVVAWPFEQAASGYFDAEWIKRGAKESKYCKVPVKNIAKYRLKTLQSTGYDRFTIPFERKRCQ
jgi:hypothetical protein